MSQPMTPQERAAAFVQAWVKQSTYTTESFINDVLEHDKETRRAALLEAAEFLKLMPMLTKDNAIAVLTKLAQEG